MIISRSEHSEFQEQQQSLTPLGEAEANQVTIKQWLEANNVKTNVDALGKLIELTITNPSTVLGEQIIQVFSDEKSNQLLEYLKKGNVQYFSNSKGIELISPRTTWQLVNTRDSSSYFLYAIAASQSLQRAASSESTIISWWETFKNKVLALPQLVGFSHKSSTLQENKDETSGLLHDVVALKMPRKYIVANIDIKVRLATLPRRKPHVFPTHTEEDS